MRRLSASNWIALLALAVSTFSVGWQIWDEVLGPELELLDLKGRPIEFRCVGDRSACWDGGRLSIILPVFFINRGAAGQTEVIDRLDLQFSPSSERAQVELIAQEVWSLVQGGTTANNRPFEPMLVPGRAADFSEVRFVDFEPEHRTTWTSFVESVVSSETTEFEVTVRAHPVIEPGVRREVCWVVFTDQLREVLEERRDDRGVPRLTTTCREGSP